MMWMNAWARVAGAATRCPSRRRTRTHADYRFLLERYVIPVVGKRRLDRLSAPEIQKLYNGMSQRGLSPRTVRYTHSVLRMALQQAVRWGNLARNPADLVALPAQPRREMKALSRAEATAFLEAAAGTRWSALWTVLLATGLRPGEALGLRWTDLSEDGTKLHVQRALTRPGGEKWELKEPKTSRGRRVVTLPPFAMEALRQHRAKQAKEKFKAGPGYQDQGFIFANHTGGPLDWRVVARRDFKRLVKEAGFPDLRPYDLRHTCATLLLAAGEHPKVVSERLGHSSTVMTMDVYSHVLPDMQQAAADKLEKMLSSGG